MFWRMKKKKISNFWSGSYVDHERNKIKYLNKIRPYLKDIINNLKKSDTWKIH